MPTEDSLRVPAYVGKAPVIPQGFLDTRDLLKHCPICGAGLFNLPSNTAVRTCIVHGDVFAIYQTTSGYMVHVNLDGVVK